jgi:hypothetical protein
MTEKTKLSDFTTEELDRAIKNAPPTAKLHIAALNSELALRLERGEAKQDFMKFVNTVWPTFIHGDHHEKMAKAFERVVNGEGKRLIINMPPRHTKSEFASYLLPAWFLGKYPNKKGHSDISHSRVGGRFRT